jgi:periplasmic protein TonB
MATAAAARRAFWPPHRFHPAALLVALFLHAAVISLLMQSSHVAPRPGAVTLFLAVPPVALHGSAASPRAVQPQFNPEPVPVTQPSAPVLEPVPPDVIPAQPPPNAEPMTRSPPPARQPLPEPALITPEETAPPAPPPTPTEALPPAEALPVPPPPLLSGVATSHPLTTQYRAHPSPLRREVPRQSRFAPQARPETAKSSLPTSTSLAASAAMPRAGAPSSATSQTISRSWEETLSAWINAHKFYPERAQQLGEQGTVTLRFTMKRDGHVIGVSLTRSSGSSILDAAAQAILRDAQIPRLPATMSQPEITVTVPIRYLLEQ